MGNKIVPYEYAVRVQYTCSDYWQKVISDILCVYTCLIGRQADKQVGATVVK